MKYRTIYTVGSNRPRDHGASFFATARHGFASEATGCHSLTHPPPPGVPGRGRAGRLGWLDGGRRRDTGPAAEGVKG
eukprot:6202019-Pleurochrysis_carterae.AAC.3